MSLLRGEAENAVRACEEFESVGRRLARSRGDTVTWPGSTCDASPEAVRYYYRYTARIGPRSFGDGDFADRLTDVPAPALVVWGARDSAALPAQRAWPRSFPNGRLLLVHGAGKGAVAERPDRVSAAVDSVLRERWPKGATRP